jgi:hypothetical protein
LREEAKVALEAEMEDAAWYYEYHVRKAAFRAWKVYSATYEEYICRHGQIEIYLDDEDEAENDDEEEEAYEEEEEEEEKDDTDDDDDDDERITGPMCWSRPMRSRVNMNGLPVAASGQKCNLV